MDHIAIGSECRVTYAFDGSGVALRARATITALTATGARIALAGDNAQAIRALGGIETEQLAAYITAAGSLAPLASFNFLD